MSYCKNIHDSVKINSNFSFPDFSEGEVSDPDIIVEVKKDLNFSTKGLSRLDFWFYGKEREDFVYFEDTFFGVKNEILLKDLGGQTEVYVNKAVLTLDRFYSPMSRRSFNDLIDTLIRIKQVQNGYLNIHAACLSKDDSAILIAAFPQMGKTLSALQLLREGFNYISDDTVLVDSKGWAYFSPAPSPIHPDFLEFIDKNQINKWKYYKLLVKNLMIEKSGFLRRIVEPPKIDLLDIGTNEREDKSKVNVACCIEMGERHLKKIDKEFLAKRIFSINGYSMDRIDNPFIWVYSYFNGFDIEKVLELERSNLLSSLGGCSCFSLACDDKNWISLFREMGVLA